MNPHDIVQVFADPLSDKGLQGYARLVIALEIVDPALGEYWLVRFIGPRGTLEREMYERWVNERNVD